MKRFILLTFFAAGLMIFVAQIAQIVCADDGWKNSVREETLTVIPPEVQYDETYSRAALTELLANLPKVDNTLADDVRFRKEIWAQNIRFARDIWCLEFSFRPMRVVAVDIPNKDGHFDRKPVWYMIYRVKNVGANAHEDGKITHQIGGLRSQLETPKVYPQEGDKKGDVSVPKCDCDICKGVVTLSKAEKNIETAKDFFKDKLAKAKEAGNTEQIKNIEAAIAALGKSHTVTAGTPLELRNEQGTYKPEIVEMPITFYPQFVLASERVVTASQSTVDENGNITSTEESIPVSYVDEIIPRAMDVICQREGRTKPLETSVSIAKKELAVGEETWGVAMWTDIHPRITKFSIYVSGLTNAYRWEDVAGEYKTGDTAGSSRQMQRKLLELHWWRMGDEHKISETQIRYGWGNENKKEGGVDYEWGYR